MQNGYAMFTPNGANLMSGYVKALDDGARDVLRQLPDGGSKFDL